MLVAFDSALVSFARFSFALENALAIANVQSPSVSDFVADELHVVLIASVRFRRVDARMDNAAFVVELDHALCIALDSERRQKIIESFDVTFS